MKDFLKKVGYSLKSWDWTKAILYWIVLSAGTASECFFLIASLYVSINASVHSLLITVIPESATVHLSELAIAAYVGLPECILALAITTTLSHIRVYLYNKKDTQALAWSVLYGLPTLVFLALSLITIGCSVLSINFQLPGYMVVIRALAGYGYGLVALLYTQLGVPQERDRLQEKDDFIATLCQEHSTNIDVLAREKEDAILRLSHEKDNALADLRRENENNLASLRNDKDLQIAEARKQLQLLTEELSKANAIIESEQRRLETLAKHNNNATLDALQAYSEECKLWLESGVKTVSIDAIMQFTGHPKRTITNAMRAGKLVTASRNKELVLVSSLVKWLEDNPPLAVKDEETARLWIVNE